MMDLKKTAEDLNKIFKDKTAEDVLTYFLQNYKGEILFSSSMGLEDQVITKMIVDIDQSTRIFTLDTGRLFPETYDLIDETRDHFGIAIEVYFPDASKVERMVKDKGVNLFYKSVENRKFCCHLRKIEPSKRALKGNRVWISGIRRDQSITRYNNQRIEWDEQNDLIKVNPLIDWSEQEVWDYIKQHRIPYNKLHDKGFPSIGCQPCTRAVKPGLDPRSGRWWWEEPEKRECGLHNRPGKS